MRPHVVFHQELGFAGDAKLILGQIKLRGTQRGPVHARAVRLIRAAIADDRATDDHRRAVGGGLGFGQGRIHGDRVHPVAVQHAPPHALKLQLRIFREGQFRAAVNGDLVVVVEHHQLVELLVAGQADRLLRHAFHQVAVAGNHPGAVVHHVVAGAVKARGQPALGHCHPHGGTDALPQGAGSHFHARSESVFGVARGLATPLPEVLEFLHRQVKSRQVEQAVEQGRTVPRREDKPVAIEPLRLARVHAQRPGPQLVGHHRGAHRQARVATVRCFHHVHGKPAQGVDGALRNGERGSSHRSEAYLPATRLTGRVCL